MSEFLKEPLPYKVTRLCFYPEEEGKPQPVFAAGVKLTTSDPWGKKVVPTYEVTLNISLGDDQRELRISPKWARELGSKLFEYASMCDQLAEADKA